MLTIDQLKPGMTLGYWHSVFHNESVICFATVLRVGKVKVYVKDETGNEHWKYPRYFTRIIPDDSPTLDVEAKAKEFEQLIDAYVENEVRPYLQSLLNKAKARMSRHTLEYSDGMGSSYFILNGDIDHRFNDALDEVALYGKSDNRICERFPELVEFKKIIYQLDEVFCYRYDAGSMQ